MLISEEVKRKGRQFKFDVPDDLIETIVWGMTGYPGFWPNKNKTPLQNFQKQLYNYFKRARELNSLYAPIQEYEDYMTQELKKYASNSEETST